MSAEAPRPISASEPVEKPLNTREGVDPHGLILRLIEEMREQRHAFQQAQVLMANERRDERRWKMVFQAMFFGAPVLLGILYFLFFLSTTGFQWGPFGKVVGIVRLEGAIGSNENASADRIIPLLEKAFVNPSVKAVVLTCDSPGGAPAESERIYTALDALKKKHPKPVVAIANNLCASAAYLIALHGDRIIAGRYSLVGSIGAVIAPWQLDKAIAKLEISQRVYASGNLKAFLNPFTPVTPEADVKAQQLVNDAAAAFVGEVKTRRGSLLKAGLDVSTGEVWTGNQAVELGLVDELGTIDEYVHTHYGEDTYDFGPAPGAVGFFKQVVSRSISSALEPFVLGNYVFR
jgi:protease-4